MNDQEDLTPMEIADLPPSVETALPGDVMKRTIPLTEETLHEISSLCSISKKTLRRELRQDKKNNEVTLYEIEVRF